MSTKTHYEIRKLRKEAQTAAMAADLLERLSPDAMEGIVTVTNLSTSTHYCVTRRETVKAIMALFPGEVWKKQADDGAIIYSLQVGEHLHSIKACDAALPPTCRVEYIEETVTRKRPVIRCGSSQPADEVAAAISDGRISGPSEAQEFIQTQLK